MEETSSNSQKLTSQVLNKLGSNNARQEVLRLLHLLRTKQIQLADFQSMVRPIVGDQLLPVLLEIVDSTSSNSAMADGDVGQMNSEALQDVMQYAGVDLKAEAEFDTFVQSAAAAGGGGGGSKGNADVRMDYRNRFNVARLRHLVTGTVVPKGIREMNEESLSLIANACLRRLGGLIEAVHACSRHRVATDRARFKIKMENDARKQIWLVEQFWKADDVKVQQGLGSAKFPTASNQHPGFMGFSTNPSSSATTSSKTGKRAAGEGSKGSASAPQDMAVKTKLANVTAAAAAGIQTKSWMTEGTAALLSSSEAGGKEDSKRSSEGGSGDHSQEAASMDDDALINVPLRFSQAPSMTPSTDRDLALQLNGRVLSLHDLLAVVLADPRLSHQTSYVMSLFNQL